MNPDIGVRIDPSSSHGRRSLRSRALLLFCSMACVPGTGLAQNLQQAQAYCASINAHWVGSPQQCACNAGFVESNNQCVSSGGGAATVVGAPGASGGLNPQQQMMMMGASAVGQVIGQGLHNWLFGDPNQAAQDAAAANARAAAAAAQAAADAAAEAARQEERRRILRERQLEKERKFKKNQNELLDELGGENSDGLDFKDDDDDSYDAKLRHFRELDQEEKAAREKALEKMKGSPDEEWCRLHMNVPFPDPPIMDPMNQYANSVGRYDHQKRMWDQRCGGPSAQEGYKDFSKDLAGLKPPQPEKNPSMEADSDDDDKMKMTSPADSAGEAASSPASGAEAQADSGPGGLGFKSDDDEARPAPRPSADVTENTAPPAAEPNPGAAAEQKPDAAPDQAAAANNGAATGQTVVQFGVSPERAGLDASPNSPGPKAAAGFAQDGTPYGGMPEQRAQAAENWVGIPAVQGMPKAGAAPDVHMDAGVWMGKPPASPDVWAYVHVAMSSLEKRGDDEARSDVKKSLKAELGIYGVIQYNESLLSEVVLSGILSASNNPNMTEAKAASWYSRVQANNLQVLFNTGSAPSQVLAKAVKMNGDVKGAVLEYGEEEARKKFDEATDKLTDAAQDEMIDGLSSSGGARLAADKYRDVKAENREAALAPAEKYAWGNYLNNRQVNDTKEYQDGLKNDARNIIANVQPAVGSLQAMYGGQP